MIRRVILLHGVWMPGISMAPLAKRLRAMGWLPEIVWYRSVTGGPDSAVAQLARRLRDDATPVNLVGHSLGGLVALRTLERHPDLSVARLLCLGTPLKGSAVARRFKGWPLMRHYLGRSTGILCEGCVQCPTRTEVGVIAGDVRHGLGVLFADLGTAHDGTVGVEETRLPGLADHVVMPVSHSGMLFSAPVVGQVDAFLRSGRFEHVRAEE